LGKGIKNPFGDEAYLATIWFRETEQMGKNMLQLYLLLYLNHMVYHCESYL